MGYARTQRGAKRRVAMQRALRRKGIDIESGMTNKKLEALYRKHLGKAPPSYEEYS